MTRNAATRHRRPLFRSRLRQKAIAQRPSIELLEDRLMLDAGGLPASIVLGRTLATPSTVATATPSPSYFVGEIENDQVTITYTVYNEAADTESGVLLTDTLEPGVSVISSTVTLDGTTATQPPDQSGQNLAWSLAPIQGYDRESVALTVNLPALGASQTTPFAIDAGAKAYAMLDAGAVSASTPAATIQPGNVSDPGLLASTVDADTNDPYIQEEAAALNYDATQIFDFLHTQIGYNSYSGSLRGARGTLWSNAGNALDVASLGVALMRASGIPAQYVSGTLSQSDAQELILSMFPASYQTVGYIPAGTQVSDPANDPQLLAETESHYWFQFESRGVMVDADTLMPGATIGQTFTTVSGTFTAVPQSLEQTTEIQLVAEIDNTADSLFGFSGLNDTTVLDQTFDDDYLVGRPLTIGNFVSQSGIEAILTSVTNTYSPYLQIGDDANPNPAQDQIIPGTSYQEVLTNFPLGSQVLTGLFVNLILSGPQTAPQTYTHAILDRLGPAARAGLAAPSVSIGPTAAPALTSQDVTTINVESGLQSPEAATPATAAAEALSQALSQQAGASGTLPPSALGALRELYVELTRLVGVDFLTSSDGVTADAARVAEVLAYSDSPRLVVTSSKVIEAGTSSTIQLAIDLLRDTLRVVVAPGQNVLALQGFNLARGLLETSLESWVVGQFMSGSPGSSVNTSAASVLAAAVQQGIPTIAISSANLSLLGALNLPDDAKALISAEVSRGLVAIVPTAPVAIGGSTTIAWLQVNPTTGEAIGVAQDGTHAASEYAGAILGVSLVAGILVGYFRPDIPQLKGHPFGTGFGGASIAYLLAYSERLPFPAALLFFVGYLIGTALALYSGKKLTDPPLTPIESDPLPPPGPGGAGLPSQAQIAADRPTGEVQATGAAAGVAVAGGVAASWSSRGSGSVLVSAVSAAQAAVTGPGGSSVGSGAVSLQATAAIAASISGSVGYDVGGNGSLSFYGPAESSLGVSGDWQNYTATVTGNASITLTVAAGALTLNGQALPAGTYTITTSSATLSGSGTMSAPNFTGSASVTATNGTLILGPGSGTLSVGGKPLDPDDETTLDGYTGAISVSANGDGTDSVSLSGNAGNVLQVTVSPPPQPSPASGVGTYVTDQNTTITFATNVQTSLAGTYNITANTPAGWTVSIDSKGDVNAMPAPGLQSGTYPIQIIAQSQTDPNLVAQTTVDVTIKPTQPGASFTVAPDSVFSVPYNGAQLPTAFDASIQNLGPAADTYNLTFSNVPTGFTILDSGTSVTVPAGETGILGIYLQPNPGQPIPAPGTQLSFTVTATSTTNSSITQTVTETFTVPNIDAVTISASPTAASTIPGGPVTETLTLANAGNVAENNITLSDTLSSGLTLTGLAPVSLAVGQSTTETITLTPAASIPLNTMLQATITATFGPSASPQTQSALIPLTVEAPGATAIANAATAANQLGDTDLANQLGDLSTAITNLVENPTSPVYMSQSTASLSAVVNLLSTDPYLGPFATTLAADGTALAAATTASAIQAALTRLGTDLGTVGSTLADEAAHGFTFSFVTNSQVAQPQVPTLFELGMQNTGSQTTTYDLSMSGLPSGVTATFSQPSITLGPGQATGSDGVPDLTVTLTSTSTTESAPFSFTVTATAEGAGEISRSVTGSLTARTQIVQVVSVTPNPTFTDPGGQVDVSARILNAVNKQQQAQVFYTVTDPSNNVIFTSQPVTTTLNVLTTLSTVDLGNLDTTGFALGQDTITVTVDDSSGNPIPRATGTGSLLIGTPVTATLSTTPTTLPAGSGTVTTTLHVALNPADVTSSSSTQVTAKVTVPANDGVSIVPNSFNVAPTSITTNANGSEALEWDLGLSSSSSSQTFTWQESVTGLQAGESLPVADDASVEFTNQGMQGTSSGASAGVAVGGTLSVSVDDSPTGTNFTQNVTLSPGTTTLDQGELTLTQSLFSSGPNAQWLVLDFEATGGRLLAGNLSGYWSIGATLPLASPSGFTGAFGYWSVNGAPTSPIYPFISGFTDYPDQPDPVNPSIYPVYAYIFPSAIASGTTSLPLSNLIYMSNYSYYLPQGGMNPNVVNGFVIGLQVTSSSPTSGTLTLPDQFVAGDQIIGLSPAARTVAPGAPASYDVTILNPTSSPVTYDLAVQGVAAGWVSLESSVTVVANGSVDVPLVLTSDSFAALADYGFTVTASGDNGAEGSVEGDLILQGQPVPPDSQSHGIVAGLTPSQATAGQGTSAHYVVQLTNTGSADDTFSLAATGLPAGVTATFGETSIDVPPGASNFRDVTLTLTTQTGTAPANYPFTVTAASTTDASVMGTANGTLTVVAAGVLVTLNPGSGAPGSSFQETVTNTGTTTDTYSLALAGPAALVASLGMKQVTLASGASQVVPITTGAVDFAVQGSLPLIAQATSTSNAAIQGAATSNLSISSSQGMTAAFNPASKTLAKPGMATFLLMVHNTGNTQDSYSATIVGANGPVAATLVGLDGSPTQSIPVFILPGLSTGAIELQADLSELGTGNVTVEVRSLTNRAISAAPTATVSAASANGPKVTDVQRFGYHMMPTTVVLTFDQALDAIMADNPKNYQIIGPAGRKIRVKSAVYNPANDTVTLRPSQRISIHHRYTLVVDGKSAGAISNTQGQALDSQAGDPGSNYRTSLTWRNLMLDRPSAKAPHLVKTRPIGVAAIKGKA